MHIKSQTPWAVKHFFIRTKKAKKKQIATIVVSRYSDGKSGHSGISCIFCGGVRNHARAYTAGMTKNGAPLLGPRVGKYRDRPRILSETLFVMYAYQSLPSFAWSDTPPQQRKLPLQKRHTRSTRPNPRHSCAGRNLATRGRQGVTTSSIVTGL
jgi:hypothetical protein